MAKTQTIICKCGCGRKKEVRVADIKRGWGKYFSKSCKAKDQEKRTGQYRKYTERQSRKSRVCQDEYDDDEYYYATTHPFSSDALGQD